MAGYVYKGKEPATAPEPPIRRMKRKPVECGTAEGARRHRHLGEKVCDPCRLARQRHHRANKSPCCGLRNQFRAYSPPTPRRGPLRPVQARDERLSAEVPGTEEGGGVSAELPEGVVTLAEALEGALEEIEEAYVNNPENKEAERGA